MRDDGALVDLYHLPHGYWEAKDEKDDLLKEVQRKLDKGYPADNTIFQAPERAILYQGGARIFDENITRPEALVSVVNQFFDYKMPRIEEWQRAVDEFSERVPELSKSVEKLIKDERLKSPAFARAFADFYALCQQAINPNLSEDAVERMLVQHLLTERIFRKIFNNPDFSKRNVVAAEIEKVITELTRRAFNRDEFPAPTGARTSPTGRSNNSAPITATRPSPNGTSSITSMPSCTTPSTASATPRISAANCRASRSSGPQGLKPKSKTTLTRP